MVLLAIGAGLTAAVISWMTCGLLLRHGAHLLDEPQAQAHKRHERPVPNVGGVGIAAAIGLCLLLGLLASQTVAMEFLERYWPTLALHWPGLRGSLRLGGWLLAGVVVLHGLGLIDDRRMLGPWVKLLVQVLVVVVVVLLAPLRIFELAGAPVSILLSVLWMLMVINAMNFLDNMDGLSAGVTAIIAAAFAVALLIGGQWFIATLACLTAGACLGFLYWNWPRARLFMGDGGSLVLGWMLAVIAMRTHYVHLPQAQDLHAGLLLIWLAPLAMLSVPFYDCASVALLRVSIGRSPMAGDHNHLSHRLVRDGLTRSQAVVRLWLATGLCCAAALWLMLAASPWPGLGLMGLVWIWLLGRDLARWRRGQLLEPSC